MSMNIRGNALVVLASLSAACGTMRWSGGGPPPAEKVETPSVALSSAPARVVEDVVVPKTPPERFKTALFYSDMGPDAVDVSSYPAQQRYDYEIYARACSRCHSLARSVNAPLVGRGWWEFYILGMRLRSRRAGHPLSKEEVQAILDFLEYDSRVRKVERAREFETLTAELKRRFDDSIAERMRALQKQNARLLPSDPDGR